MRRILIWGAILFLPGGIIIGIFHVLRHERKKLLEIFSRLKEKFFS